MPPCILALPAVWLVVQGPVLLALKLQHIAVLWRLPGGAQRIPSRRHHLARPSSPSDMCLNGPSSVWPLTVMVALLLPFLPMAVDWPGERYTTRLAGKYCSSTPRALGGATNCTPQAPAQMRLSGCRLAGGAGIGRKGMVFCPTQAFEKGFAPSELSRAQGSTHLDAWTQKLYRLLQRRYNMKDSRHIPQWSGGGTLPRFSLTDTSERLLSRQMCLLQVSTAGLATPPQPLLPTGHQSQRTTYPGDSDHRILD